MLKKYTLTAIFIGLSGLIFAQQLRGFYSEEHVFTPVFSYARVSINEQNLKTIPRLSLSAMHRIHYGWKVFGFSGGLGASNLGVITQPNDSTILKRRVYTLTPEAGIRFGFPKAGVFMGLAGDVPIHYKEKEITGKRKIRTTEFFSDKISRFIPSAYAGLSFHYFEIRAQYLLGNFFNKKNPAFLNTKTDILNIALSFNHLYFQQFFKNLGGGKKYDEYPKPETEEKDKDIRKTAL
jgi:hypothetical protein